MTTAAPEKTDSMSRVERRAKAESDFYWFSKEIMGYPDLHEPLHRKVCDWLQHFEDVPEEIGNLELARGHFKTTLADICYITWRLMRDPDLRILVCHGKRDTAVKILSEIKFHMEHNDDLKSIAPDVFYRDPAKQSPSWKQDEIFVKIRDKRNLKVPSIMATGVDASVVGLHFGMLIHDDLVYRENVGTNDAREKTREYRRESLALLVPHKGNSGKLLNIGTRWHYDDAHQELEDGFNGQGPYTNQVWQLKMGCRDEETGEPLFPTRWTNEKLESQRQRMGSFTFACQFENNPVPDDQQTFKRTDLRWFEDLPGYHEPEHLRRPYLFFTAVDPNRTEQTQNDPCVVMTAARDPDGHIWIVDMSRGHPTGTELVKIIRSHLQRWEPETLILETNNYQYQLQRWLEEDMIRIGRSWHITPVVRGPTTRKYDRISALQPLVERGALHIREGMEVVAQELEHWPAWNHDDTLDTLADVYNYGWNPKPAHVDRAVPTSHNLMQSVLDDIRGQSGSSRIARLGSRTASSSSSGWILS